MNDPNKELLTDLNFRTALLESVDWDETQSDSLLQYLHESLSSTAMLADEILNAIKNVDNKNIMSKINKTRYV